VRELLPHGFTNSSFDAVFFSVALSTYHYVLPLAANPLLEVPTFLSLFSLGKEWSDYLDDS
jgi:hypothetical protein